MTSIPTLRTDRLILRAPTLEDFPAFADFYASPQADMLGGRVDAMTAWSKLCSLIGHWNLRGFGRWVVEERQSGAYCGHVGCHQPHGWPDREIAWSVTSGAQGRGIAYQAAFAARAYAFETLRWATAISLVEPINGRSATLARRLGARPDGEWTHPEGVKLVVYRHPEPDNVGEWREAYDGEA